MLVKGKGLKMKKIRAERVDVKQLLLLLLLLLLRRRRQQQQYTC